MAASHTVHRRVLKKGKFEIMDLLAVVCDLSFKPAFVLEKWKVVKVMPIFNKILQAETHKLLEVCAKQVGRAYSKE